MSCKNDEKKQWPVEKKVTMRISVISIIVNLTLSGAKLIVGVIAGSGALISDGIHSASDVFSTFIVIAGVNMSTKASDENHQYGHERMECIAAVILATVLCAVGIGIGVSGFMKILEGNYSDLSVPGVAALAVAGVSIAVKEWMYWFTRSGAKKIKSGALMADAWHHRSDALSSIGSFAGILGARLGFPVLDPVASVIICIFIVKVSFDIYKDAMNKMVDKSCDEETIEKMREVILSHDGVMGIDLLQTRLFGSKIYVDVEISADGRLTLIESHKIAEEVHRAIEKNFPDVKHCMVHMNPKI